MAAASGTRAAAQEVRRLIRARPAAMLATTEPDGAPAASLATVAAAWDGSPILLLSALAAHTRNLAADPRAALLFDGTAGHANPQAGPRASLMGRIRPANDSRLAARYLARHPHARAYAGFDDFRFHNMEVERIHFVGGFARALWLDPGKVLAPKRAALAIARIEAEVLDHMNADHGEALALYGRVLLGGRGKHWRMIGIDPLGCDLRCGNSVHRLDFDYPVGSAADCRRALSELATRARDLCPKTATADTG